MVHLSVHHIIPLNTGYNFERVYFSNQSSVRPILEISPGNKFVFEVFFFVVRRHHVTNSN